jgi:hypothetical protein
VSTCECPREAEIIGAVLAGRIRAGRRADSDSERSELTGHAEGCEVCRELLLVASAVREDGEHQLAAVQVPPAGQVWWRAAIRSRLDAARAAERPITWAHGVAGACMAGFAAGVIGIAWPTVERGLGWLGDRWSIAPAAVPMTELTAAMMQRTLPFALLAVCVVLAPVALYLVLAEDDR